MNLATTASLVMAGASTALFFKAKAYEQQAREEYESLSRLEKIAMIYLQDKNSKSNLEETNMKTKKSLKLFSKISNKTLLIGSVGVGLMGAAAIKGIFFDGHDDGSCTCECSPIESITDAAEEATEDIIPE